MDEFYSGERSNVKFLASPKGSQHSRKLYTELITFLSCDADLAAALSQGTDFTLAANPSSRKLSGAKTTARKG